MGDYVDGLCGAQSYGAVDYGAETGSLHFIRICRAGGCADCGSILSKKSDEVVQT